MRSMIYLLALLLPILGGLAIFTQWKTRQIEARNPPIGTFHDVGGYRLHALHLLPDGAASSLPPVVFLHGASGNLKDQYLAFGNALEGRAELLFVDRPGHGYSERGGPENDLPSGQADAVAGLMASVGIDRAVVVAHSFGSAIAASLALQHPDKVAGLVFLAPATHPWPGGVAWFYGAARSKLAGPVFTNLLSLPVGLGRVAEGTRCVFAPNVMPADYPDLTSPELVLRPRTFRANGTDVANLNDYVRRVAPRYPEITAPTVIITGDRDSVVRPDIHSEGLERDIAGAELVTIRNLGHKPDYIANDVAVAAIRKVAGEDIDLQAMARAVEARIANDDVRC